MSGQTWETIKKSLEKYAEAQKCMAEAQDILRNGPESFYVKQMQGYIEYLFNVAAPFKVGDRVALSKDIECTGNWRGCEHFLKKNAQGVVDSVDIWDGDFICHVVFDDESYIQSWGDDKGKIIPVKEKHTFAIRETNLVKIGKENVN